MHIYPIIMLFIVSKIMPFFTTATFFYFFLKERNRLLQQLRAHLLHATALLLFVGMNVEVEGGADVSVAEEDADGFVVTTAFDAAGCETVAQTMKLHRW